MFALARFGRLSMLLAVASAFAFTQGCAAETDEGSSEAEASVDAITTSQSADRLLDVPFYYVATIVFVDGQADIEKARRLSQNPVP